MKLKVVKQTVSAVQWTKAEQRRRAKEYLAFIRAYEKTEEAQESLRQDRRNKEIEMCQDLLSDKRRNIRRRTN